MAHHDIITTKSPKDRTSAFRLQIKGSDFRKGSITLEAAVSVSFFFLAILCISYLFELMVLQTVVANALCAVGKEMAVEACINPFFSAGQIEKKLVQQIGSEKLDRSIIVDGAAGIDCSASKRYGSTTIMELSAVYRIEIPILLFRIPVLRQEETLRVKGWTGYEGSGGGQSNRDIVYITGNGLVYHEERDCTYLDMSVKMVSKENVDELRNQSGGKYYACRYCGGESENSTVYITEYGNRYHSTLNCSRIKRQVYEIPRKEAYGMGGCSKCVH